MYVKVIRFEGYRRKFRGLVILSRRLIYRNRTSYPYISGDAFSKIVDYSPLGRNGLQSPDLKRLREARSIFLPGHLLRHFFQVYNAEVNAKVLVTGNSDENFTTIPELPNSIKYWFSQNLALRETRTSLKVATIPIGLENLSLGRSGLIKYLKNKNSQIYNRVLVPPMAPSNKIRIESIREIKNSPGIFDLFEGYLKESEYFKLVSKYKFVLCLEGNGFENHRIWETLYRNAFPVVLTSPWSISLKHLDLPILYIDKIQDCNQTIIEQFLRENQSFDCRSYPKIWMPYWQTLIRKLEND